MKYTPICVVRYRKLVAGARAGGCGEEGRFGGFVKRVTPVFCRESPKTGFDPEEKDVGVSPVMKNGEGGRTELLLMMSEWCID